MLTFSRACPLARVPLFAHNTLHPHLFLTLLSPFSHLHLFLTFIFFSPSSFSRIHFSRIHFPHRFFSYHFLLTLISHSIHHFRALLSQTFFIALFFHLQSTFILAFHFPKQYL
jgi:hypothetical protein